MPRPEPHATGPKKKRAREKAEALAAVLADVLFQVQTRLLEVKANLFGACTDSFVVGFDHNPHSFIEHV